MKKYLYKCKFENCERQLPILSKGYCPYHNSIVFPKVKKIYAIKKISETNKKPLKISYSDFFLKHENIIKCEGLKCMNCNNKLSGSFWEVAHILPKSKYPSVGKNDDNIMYLCAGLGEDIKNCHSFFDKNQNNFEILKTMPIFAEVKLKYEKFKHLVLENGREKQILN